MGNRWIVTVLLFGLGLGVPFAAGLYSKSTSKRDGSKAVLRFPAGAKAPEPAVVDLGRLAGVKGTVQPWRVRLYARVHNASAEPRRVKIVLQDCPVPVEWYSRDYTWDEETRAIAEALPPGKKFGTYLFVQIPRDLRHRPVVCDGLLKALDPQSGELLASVPVRILNSGAGPVPGGVSKESMTGALPDGALHN